MNVDCPQDMASAIALGAIGVDEAITDLADRDRESDIGALISTRISEDAEAIARALAAGTPEPIGTLCRAAGIGVNGYSALLRMLRRRGQHLTGSVSILLSSYLTRPRPTRGEIAEALKVTPNRALSRMTTAPGATDRRG